MARQRPLGPPQPVTVYTFHSPPPDRVHEHGLSAARRRSEVPATLNGEPEVTITELPSFSVMATRRSVGVLPGVQRGQRGPSVEMAEDRLVRGSGQGVAEGAPLAHSVPGAPAVAHER